MGRDKGALRYTGQPQALRAVELLRPLCRDVFVSIRPDQADGVPYRDMQVLLDKTEGNGPLTGLVTAFDFNPDAAWMVLACDLPLIDAPSLAYLLDHRDPQAVATAFLAADGLPEPLCAVYEPHCRARLRDTGLREVLIRGPSRLLEAPVPHALTNVNTNEDYERVMACFFTGAPGFHP